MDLDRVFVAAILREGREAVRQALDRGIDLTYLEGAPEKKDATPEGAAKAWGFVLDYVKTYPDCPTPDVVFGKTGVDVGDAPQESAAFFIDEIRNRQLHKEISKQLRKVITKVEEADPVGAFDAYESGVRDLRGLHLATAKTEALWQQADEFLDLYEKLKNGYTGIRTPWPTLNEDTLGFWPEDFVLFVARLGVGKTWLLVFLMLYARHVEDKKVLFATTEMSKAKILQRAVAAHFKLPYDDLRRGRLNPWAENKMKEGLKELESDENLRIIGGDFDFRIESLEAAIEECEPDILFVDGAYLLRTSGDGRLERAANSFDELKRVAKRAGIPVVATTQFNRDAKVNKAESASVEKIALSDAAGWNADLIYGLIQTEDMKKDGRMVLKPMKFREGSGGDLELMWDFVNMIHDEIPRDGAAMPKGAGQAVTKKTQDDEFGTGLSLFDEGGEGDSGDDLPF